MPLSTRQLEAHSKHRLRAGQRKQDVQRFLVEEGMDPDEAATIVSDSLNRLRQQALTILLSGGGLVLLGIIASLLATQASDGVVLFLWWGPTLVGLLISMAGLWRWIRLRRG